MNSTLRPAPTKIPFFPARPVNGGPLNQARPKIGRWIYEPKVNEERVFVHTSTMRMFNRHGEPFTKSGLFVNVLAKLNKLDVPELEWLDCGAFGHRLPVGKGSLLVFDLPLVDGNYDQRQQMLYDLLIANGPGESWAHEQFAPPDKAILSFAYAYDDASDSARAATPLNAWRRLPLVNEALGCEIFEGLVAKRRTSLYPRQSVSAAQEFGGWMKHRWH